MATELVWEPQPKHLCRSSFESSDKRFGTIVVCLDCGQHWFVGWTMMYSDCKKWRKVRWYNFRLRGRL